MKLNTDLQPIRPTIQLLNTIFSNEHCKAISNSDSIKRRIRNITKLMNIDGEIE